MRLSALLTFTFVVVIRLPTAHAMTNTTANSRLAPFQYGAFPLGSIKASGWLEDQLSLAAEALPGHMFDFYRYVADSTWLGGTHEYSELHESAPYWFNYIVPLAYTLDDSRLKKQAKAFLDYTLEHQAEDGWLGPETTRQTRGIWARSLLFFALIVRSLEPLNMQTWSINQHYQQYAEADPSETDRIVTAMHRFTDLIHSMLQNNFTGLLQDVTEGDEFDPYGFGVSRTHELPLALQWLYESHPRGNHEVIWETMELMFAGGRKGDRDWTTFFVEGVFPVGTPDNTSGFTHGVNLAQGIPPPRIGLCVAPDSCFIRTSIPFCSLSHDARYASLESNA